MSQDETCPACEDAAKLLAASMTRLQAVRLKHARQGATMRQLAHDIMAMTEERDQWRIVALALAKVIKYTHGKDWAQRLREVADFSEQFIMDDEDGDERMYKVAVIADTSLTAPAAPKGEGVCPNCGRAIDDLNVHHGPGGCVGGFSPGKPFPSAAPWQSAAPTGEGKP